MTTIWMRAELKPNEQRAPIAPEGVIDLVNAGFRVVVEDDPARAIPTEAYRRAGAKIVGAGDWRNAPDDAIIIAVKEFPASEPGPFRHRHIHFGHLFKDQAGWRDGLARFRDGGGVLYDLEYLTDENGKRVAAFGHWAGYAGAALSLILWSGVSQNKTPPIGPQTAYRNDAELVSAVSNALGDLTPRPLILGANGRSGKGAFALFETLGIEPTLWDIAETAGGAPFPEILSADILVNCALVTETTPIFVPRDTKDDLGRRLMVVADISCDPNSPHNPLPIYNRTTTFDEPALDVGGEGAPLWVTAIDHLPSLLPAESSRDYAAQLLPTLLTLDKLDSGVWARAKSEFDKQVARL